MSGGVVSGGAAGCGDAGSCDGGAGTSGCCGGGITMVTCRCIAARAAAAAADCVVTTPDFGLRPAIESLLHCLFKVL